MGPKPAHAPLAGAVAKAWKARWRFLVAFLLVFFLTFSVLIALDWVPDGPAASAGTATTTPLVSNSPNALDAFPTTDPEEPVKIEAKSIGLSATIANPTTTDVDALDQY